MTSLLGNCFFSRHSTAFVQYQCYKLPYVSVKLQNLKSQNILQKYFLTSLLENCFLVVTQHCSAVSILQNALFISKGSKPQISKYITKKFYD